MVLLVRAGSSRLMAKYSYDRRLYLVPVWAIKSLVQGGWGLAVCCPRSVAAGCSALTIALALVGCTVVDQFSGRAVGFNIEAEQALDQGLLLNIVRASQRRPMQFTSVQSISGTASASASASTMIPFGAGGAQYKTGTFGANVSGGPTFSVPVLDTQEFYQGVMTPISSRLFDFFIHEGYPAEELFTLFVEKIVLHRDTCKPWDHRSECELVFINYPGNDLQFDLTQSMIEHLLNLGLTTEQLAVKSAKSASAGGSGSSTADAPAAEFRFCFAARDDESRGQLVGDALYCGYEAAKKPAKKKTLTTTVNSQKTTTDPTGQKTTEKGTTTTVAPDTSTAESTDQTNRRKAVGKLILSDEFIHKLKLAAARTLSENDRNMIAPDDERSASRREYDRFMDHIDWFGATVPQQNGKGRKKNPLTFSIITRSTEGILYFLGEIVRNQISPDTILHPERQPKIAQVKIETTSYRKFPELPCDPNYLLKGQGDGNKSGDFVCQNLFVLDAAHVPIGLSDASVIYRGVQYSVPSDRDRQGKTMHVLSIVKQLLAVNMSAKSLPQTNIISVISP